MPGMSDRTPLRYCCHWAAPDFDRSPAARDHVVERWMETVLGRGRAVRPISASRCPRRHRSSGAWVCAYGLRAPRGDAIALAPGALTSTPHPQPCNPRWASPLTCPRPIRGASSMPAPYAPRSARGRDDDRGARESAGTVSRRRPAVDCRLRMWVGRSRAPGARAIAFAARARSPYAQTTAPATSMAARYNGSQILVGNSTSRRAPSPSSVPTTWSRAGW